MKEVYSKPVLHVETFRLSQSIASGCAVPPAGQSTIGRANQWGRASCGWNMGNVVLWVEAPQCDLPTDPNAEVNGVCYNNPNGGVTIFHS